MITPDLDSPRFREITPSTEDVGCESGLDLISRLRDADAVKWTVTWKSGLDRWQLLKDELQTETEGIRLDALAACVGHVPFLDICEPISEETESGVTQELRGLAKAFRVKPATREEGIKLLEEMLVISDMRARRLYRCFAGEKWSALKDRTSSDEEVPNSLRGVVDSPVVNVTTGGGNPRSGEKEIRCSVLIEGVEEPLSLDDALAIATNWDAVNKRRVRLIEKKAARQITDQEAAELQHLQRLAWAKRQMVMPLPLKQLAAIEEALRRMQLWQDE